MGWTITRQDWQLVHACVLRLPLLTSLAWHSLEGPKESSTEPKTFLKPSRIFHTRGLILLGIRICCLVGTRWGTSLHPGLTKHVSYEAPLSSWAAGPLASEGSRRFWTLRRAHHSGREQRDHYLTFPDSASELYLSIEFRWVQCAPKALAGYSPHLREIHTGPRKEKALARSAGFQSRTRSQWSAFELLHLSNSHSSQSRFEQSHKALPAKPPATAPLPGCSQMMPSVPCTS